MTINQIAVIAHEANRHFCVALGDYSQRVWDDAPDWARESAVAGVRAHLKALSGGKPLSFSASHDSWLEHKEADGWKYGPVKDPAKKEHPCMVPFNKLPPEQQAKDRLFSGIVAALEPLIDLVQVENE